MYLVRFWNFLEYTLPELHMLQKIELKKKLTIIFNVPCDGLLPTALPEVFLRFTPSNVCSIASPSPRTLGFSRTDAYQPGEPCCVTSREESGTAPQLACVLDSHLTEHSHGSGQKDSITGLELSLGLAVAVNFPEPLHMAGIVHIKAKPRDASWHSS